jgi:nucleoside-diphosphate-sugar epimerase
LKEKRLLDNKVTGHKRYAISSEEVVKLKDLVKLYEQVPRSKLKIEWGARPYRAREVMVPWDKGESLPGWRPLTSLQEGIRKLLFKDKII